MRVQRLLAQAGIASRRKCEDLISDGVVTVNGKKVKLGDVAEASDDVRINGRKIIAEKKTYLLFNKPKGYIVTKDDDQGRDTIFELLKKIPSGVFPVGRLDKDSEGVLLLTNDGDFAQKVLHPSHEIEKEYEVILNKPLALRDQTRLQKGIPLDRKKVSMKLRGSNKKITVVIHEGRKRILRRIFMRIGYDVKSLKRIRIGTLRLKGVIKGGFRTLTKEEVKKFMLL